MAKLQSLFEGIKNYYSSPLSKLLEWVLVVAAGFAGYFLIKAAMDLSLAALPWGALFIHQTAMLCTPKRDAS